MRWPSKSSRHAAVANDHIEVASLNTERARDWKRRGLTLIISWLLICNCEIELAAQGNGQFQLTAPRAMVTEDLRIDAVKEDLVPLRFSAWTGLLVGATGGMVFRQPQDFQLLLYDVSGRKVTSIGGRGQGPGEFTSIGPMGWLGDTLWVADFDASRITRFSATGKILGTASFRADVPRDSGQGATPPTHSAFRPRALLSQGLLVGSAQVSMPSGVETHMILVSLEGKLIKRITAADINDTRMAVAERASQAGNYFVAQVPLYPEIMRDIDVNGKYMILVETIISSATSCAIVLNRKATLGGGLSSWRYSFSSAPVTSRVADSLIEDRLRGRNLPPSTAARFAAELRARMPKTYPPVIRVLAGRDSTTWLELRTTSEGRPWLVLSAQGAPLRTIILPTNVQIRQADLTRIWATETDADGLQSVVRYKVQGA